jgi:hypothetical protein
MLTHNKEFIMDTQKIIFKIDQNGGLTVEGVGFKGETCLEKSRAYLDALGVVAKQDKKPEYFENAEVRLTQYL